MVGKYGGGMRVNVEEVVGEGEMIGGGDWCGEGEYWGVGGV